MKIFLLLLTMLLASNGEQQSHEHGFSSLASPAKATVFKFPVLVLDEQDQDHDATATGFNTTTPIPLAANAAAHCATHTTPRQPALAGHPIRGPPKARV